MKKLSLLIILILIPTFFWLKGGRRPIGASSVPKKAAENVGTEAVFQTHATETSAVELPAERPPQANNAEKPIQLPLACQDFWKQVSDFRPRTANVALPELSNRQACAVLPAALPKALHETHKQYLALCAGKKSSPQCVSLAQQYRALVRDWQTRDVPVSEITDESLLVDKLAARFGEGPEKAKAVIDRMLELNPDNYQAAKAAIVAQMAQTFRSSEATPPSPSNLDALTKAIDRAERLPGAANDPQILEARIQIAAKLNDMDAVETYARRQLNEFPAQRGEALYHLALAEYRRGNADKMFNYLRGAIEANPKNPIYKDTLKMASKIPADTLGQPGPKPKIFAGFVGFQLDPVAAP